MDPLEQSLRHALARKEPSPGFAARVAGAARQRPPAFRPPRWWMATAAMVVIAAGSGVAWRHRQGEIAKEQVMTAMRITAVKLNRVQAHVREVRQ
jgi:hypothetical protein